jgi:ribosome maturation factor RimP
MNLHELIEKTVTGLGYELVDLEMSPRARVLRIFIDKPENARGVNIDDCVAVSNQLSRVLMVENIDYDRLEVSSPGLDRPLRTRADFERFAGRLAKIVTAEPIARQTAFAGHLRGVEGDDVLFENEGGKLVRLPLGLIRRARLEVEF